jgi:hypothetical protein
MIGGQWGKPSEVLLELVVEEDGSVSGVANRGRQNAPIRRGHFDAATGVVNLEGEHVAPSGRTLPFHITGRLDGRTLSLTYEYGDVRGETDVVRVEEHAPGRLTLGGRLRPRIGFAELSNPTLGFYDHMGGERLLDDRGQFGGAYGWRDVRVLI